MNKTIFIVVIFTLLFFSIVPFALGQESEQLKILWPTLSAQEDGGLVCMSLVHSSTDRSHETIGSGISKESVLLPSNINIPLDEILTVRGVVEDPNGDFSAWVMDTSQLDANPNDLYFWIHTRVDTPYGIKGFNSNAARIPPGSPKDLVIFGT